MSESFTPWIAEPMSMDEVKRELRMVIDELSHKSIERRVLTDQILELESDRTHLLRLIEVLAEERLEQLEAME